MTTEKQTLNSVRDVPDRPGNPSAGCRPSDLIIADEMQVARDFVDRTIAVAGPSVYVCPAPRCAQCFSS